MQDDARMRMELRNVYVVMTGIVLTRRQSFSCLEGVAKANF
jgi:hypothetical protein